jgi:transcriptional regulator with XRE-family HTH domain
MKKPKSGAIDQRPAATAKTSKPPRVKSATERKRRKEKESHELKKLLLITGLSPTQFAKKVNTRVSAISEFTHGKHELKVNTLKKWCDIVNVDIRLLFSDVWDKWE